MRMSREGEREWEWWSGSEVQKEKRRKSGRERIYCRCNIGKSGNRGKKGKERKRKEKKKSIVERRQVEEIKKGNGKGS